MKQFRFQSLDVWQRAVEVGHVLYPVAHRMEERRYYRFAEQLRGATLSISNNIAEGSGSLHDREFANFLNIARRSVFECANMLLVFVHEGYLEPTEVSASLAQLEELSRMILGLIRSLDAEDASGR